MFEYMHYRSLYSKKNSICLFLRDRNCSSYQKDLYNYYTKNPIILTIQTMTVVHNYYRVD